MGIAFDLFKNYFTHLAWYDVHIMLIGVFAVGPLVLKYPELQRNLLSREKSRGHGIDGSLRVCDVRNMRSVAGVSTSTVPTPNCWRQAQTTQRVLTIN